MKNSEKTRDQLLKENHQLKSKVADLEKSQIKQSSLEEYKDISFRDLFNIKDIQKLQDEFSNATGVASIITDITGVPITKESNFTYLCNNIIRKTKKGLANCYESDAKVGKQSIKGPSIQPCLSGGLWDAGAGISIEGKHIANWLIGQVRDETQTEDQMIQYAKKIGTDESAFLRAFHEVPAMSRKKFEQIAQVLFTLANQLSKIAYQNIQKSKYIAEQKETEEALKESEERFKTAFESANDCILIWDKEYNYLYANQSAIDHVGTTRENVIGKNIRDGLGHIPDFMHLWMKRIDTVFKTKSVLEVTDKTEMHGENVYTNSIISPIMDDHNNVSSVCVVYRNITDIMKAEEALKASEGKYKRLVEHQSDMIVKVDIEGRFLYVSPSYCKFFGKSDKDLLNKKFIPLVHKDDVEKTEIAMKKLFKPPYTCYIEQRAKTKDGWKWLSWTDSAILNEKNEVIEIIGLGRDITERKQAEEKGKLNEERYRLLFNLLPYGCEVIDTKGNIINCSSSTAKMLGYKVSEMIGKHITKFLTQDSVQIFKQKFPVLLKGKPIDAEIRMICKDGTKLDVLRAAQPILGSNGKVESMLALNLDITKRKQAEDKLNAKVKQLEMMNDIMVDRELAINETRKEVNELLAKLGEEEKYRTI